MTSVQNLKHNNILCILMDWRSIDITKPFLDIVRKRKYINIELTILF